MLYEIVEAVSEFVISVFESIRENQAAKYDRHIYYRNEKIETKRREYQESLTNQEIFNNIKTTKIARKRLFESLNNVDSIISGTKNTINQYKKYLYKIEELKTQLYNEAKDIKNHREKNLIHMKIKELKNTTLILHTQIDELYKIKLSNIEQKRKLLRKINSLTSKIRKGYNQLEENRRPAHRLPKSFSVNSEFKSIYFSSYSGKFRTKYF